MLMGYPSPKPVGCPRVMLCVCEGFPLQMSCSAREGRGNPVVGAIPRLKLPEDSWMV